MKVKLLTALTVLDAYAQEYDKLVVEPLRRRADRYFRRSRHTPAPDRTPARDLVEVHATYSKRWWTTRNTLGIDPAIDLNYNLLAVS